MSDKKSRNLIDLPILTISAKEAYRQYADATKKEPATLTIDEKSIALLNYIFEHHEDDTDNA